MGALTFLGLLAILLPLVPAVFLGITLTFGLHPSEARITRLVAWSFALCLVACLGVIALSGGEAELVLARWFVLSDYAIEARVRFDLPAAVLMTLTALLCGLVGAFSAPYLHRDPGFRRFYLLLALFASGMMAVASAATLDLLYAGWEVVGLSSALLIAYFHQRENPVRHGLRAFAVYRVCDVALLTAAVLLHQANHGVIGPVEGAAGTWIGLLLVFAAMGKAAAFPFTGWLPRAMEGPTPSSAIFYGALSIHAGPYLLIRAWPLVEGPVVQGVLVFVGALTALHATMVGRVQTEFKCALGYASVAQVGLILVEIGLGMPQLALLHLSGHAVLRTWQLLRAPSLIRDRQRLIALMGEAPARRPFGSRLLPAPVRPLAYRLALERWFLDDLGDGLLAVAGRALKVLDQVDRRVVSTLAGRDGV